MENSPTPQELAHRYIEIIFGGEPLDQLSTILHPECRFEGPFLQTDTAIQYIEAMKADPPSDFKCIMMHVFEKANIVCLVYRFKKGNKDTVMTQLFETEGHQIARIILIFNPNAL